MQISDSDDYDEEDTISGEDEFGFGQMGAMGFNPMQSEGLHLN